MRKRHYTSIFIDGDRRAGGSSPARPMLRGALLSLLLALVTQWMHNTLSLAATARWLVAGPGVLLAGALSLYSFWLLVFFATLRPMAAGCVVGACASIMAVIDYVKMAMRGEPFVPRDMAMALNLDQLASMVSWGYLVALILILALLALACALLWNRLRAQRFTPVARVAGLALSAALVAGTLTMGLQGNPLRAAYSLLGADFRPYHTNVYGSYGANGFYPAFFSQITQPLMQRPEGYSRDAVEAIVARYTAKAGQTTGTGRRPNVVFVMSEAFSDPIVFSAYQYSQDPIPGIRAVGEASRSGQALTPGQGGATAHCEFEALTGFSVAFCGGISPFENNLNTRDTFPSVPGVLAAEGYRTVALHPYNSSMYARPNAYRALGFQEFITQLDMRHTDRLKGSPYISDQSAYNEVLDILAESDSPVFVHLVTMQNHGGYPQGRFTGTITATGPEGERAVEQETYARGLAHTDAATVEFLQALEEQGEDTLVLFWGDHLPLGYPQDWLDEQGLPGFQTPFFLWSATGEEAADLGIWSPVFFPLFVRQSAGGELTPFLALLEELSAEVRGVRTTGALTVDGEFVEHHGLPVLEQYRMIQYDCLLGEGYAAEAGFFLT